MESGPTVMRTFSIALLLLAGLALVACGDDEIAGARVRLITSAADGAVQGEVQRISPTTHLDEKRNPYYRAEIALSQDHLGDNSALLRIIPGMTVQADIQTGSKRLIDYLLRPISRGFGNAFHER